MTDTGNILHGQHSRREDLRGSPTISLPEFPELDQFTEDQQMLAAIFHGQHGSCSPDYLVYLRSDLWLDLHCTSCGAFRTYPPSIDSERGGE